MDYTNKYLKYKNKFLNLRKQIEEFNYINEDQKIADFIDPINKIKYHALRDTLNLFNSEGFGFVNKSLTSNKNKYIKISKNRYNNKCGGGFNNTSECVVCLEQMEPSDTIEYVETNCGHVYHLRCILNLIEPHQLEGRPTLCPFINIMGDQHWNCDTIITAVYQVSTHYTDELVESIGMDNIRRTLEMEHSSSPPLFRLDNQSNIIENNIMNDPIYIEIQRERLAQNAEAEQTPEIIHAREADRVLRWEQVYNAGIDTLMDEEVMDIDTLLDLANTPLDESDVENIVSRINIVMEIIRRALIRQERNIDFIDREKARIKELSKDFHFILKMMEDEEEMMADKDNKEMIEETIYNYRQIFREELIKVKTELVAIEPMYRIN